MAFASTQKYLHISEFRNDMVILKDGTLRMVIMCSSVNFALKGEDEQSALIAGYMEFLNSMDYPIQIVIQSRKLDIEGYMRRLQEAQKAQTNELLKTQIDGYRGYINQLIEMQEIMTKKFFIVIPFNPLGSKNKSFFARLKESLFPVHLIRLRKEKLAEYKDEIMLRADNVMSNLRSMGLEAVVLDTQSLIELYYNVYNPKTSQNERLKDVSQMGLEA